MATEAEVIKSHIMSALAQLYTALPAKVDSYDSKTRTISATPLVGRLFEDGLSMKNISIDDIPVVFPSGGGAEVTLPIKKGDQVLLIFSMRNIQDWMISDGQTVTSSTRKTHRVQDAIAIPSMFTKKQAKEANPDHMELLFGDSKIQIQENSKIVIESGTVELGDGATQSAVLGEELKDWLENHQHGYSDTTPAGTTVGKKTSTPADTVDPLAGTIVIADNLPSSALSSKVKVK